MKIFIVALSLCVAGAVASPLRGLPEDTPPQTAPSDLFKALFSNPTDGSDDDSGILLTDPSSNEMLVNLSTSMDDASPQAAPTGSAAAPVTSLVTSGVVPDAAGIPSGTLPVISGTPPGTVPISAVPTPMTPVAAAAVPEIGSLTMLGAGLVILSLVGRRKQAKG